MSEQQPNPEQPEQQISIRSVYLKDASFESPSAPQIFQERHQPTVEVNLGVNTQPVGEDHYEVVLSVTVTAKVEERTAFLVEIQQGGIFMLRGFPADHLGAMLGAYCPSTLFPYAREAVASLVGKGGFPPVMLEPVNFEAMYASHLQQQAQGPQ